MERVGNSLFEFSTLSTGRHFHRAFDFVVFGAQRRSHRRLISFFLFGLFFRSGPKSDVASQKSCARMPLGTTISRSLDPRYLPFCSRLLTPVLFAHRLATHLDAVGVMHQPVENAVGQGGIPRSARATGVPARIGVAGLLSAFAWTTFSLAMWVPPPFQWNPSAGVVVQRLSPVESFRNDPGQGSDHPANGGRLEIGIGDRLHPGIVAGFISEWWPG